MDYQRWYRRQLWLSRHTWLYEIRDAPTRWWYRLWYCRRHGHRAKMDSRGYCVNCGTRVR